jgi:hypothetical protein
MANMEGITKFCSGGYDCYGNYFFDNTGDGSEFSEPAKPNLRGILLKQDYERN